MRTPSGTGPAPAQRRARDRQHAFAEVVDVVADWLATRFGYVQDPADGLALSVHDPHQAQHARSVQCSGIGAKTPQTGRQRRLHRIPVRQCPPRQHRAQQPLGVEPTPRPHDHTRHGDPFAVAVRDEHRALRLGVVEACFAKSFDHQAHVLVDPSESGRFKRILGVFQDLDAAFVFSHLSAGSRLLGLQQALDALGIGIDLIHAGKLECRGVEGEFAAFGFSFLQALLNPRSPREGMSSSVSPEGFGS